MVTPRAILPTTYQLSQVAASPSAKPPASSSSARWMNGNASPSLRPASEVSEKRMSSS